MNRHVGWLGLLGLLGLWALPGLVFAHGEEDHGDGGAKAAVATSSAYPRMEASSPDFQVVAILHDRALALYLDRYATNRPDDGGKRWTIAACRCECRRRVSGERHRRLDYARNS